MPYIKQHITLKIPFFLGTFFSINGVIFSYVGKTTSQKNELVSQPKTFDKERDF